MCYLADGQERAFIQKEQILIPEDTGLPPDLYKNGENFLSVKMEFLRAEQFEQNKVLQDKILKWREVPTEVTYGIESVEEIAMKVGVTMVVSLVDDDEMSF